MDVGTLKILLKGMKNTDQIVLWEYTRKDGSKYTDLQPVIEPKRNIGYLVLGKNLYAGDIDVKK